MRRQIPKLDVAGSTPVARSREFEELAPCRYGRRAAGASLVALGWRTWRASRLRRVAGALLGPHRRPEPGCHLHSGDTRPCTQVHPKPLDSWTPAAFLLLGSHLHWGCRRFLAGSNGSMTLGRTVGSVKSNADRRSEERRVGKE